MLNVGVVPRLKPVVHERHAMCGDRKSRSSSILQSCFNSYPAGILVPDQSATRNLSKEIGN